MIGSHQTVMIGIGHRLSMIDSEQAVFYKGKEIAIVEDAAKASKF